MDEKLRNDIFLEEYERERARYAYRSDREKKSAENQKRFSYLKEVVVFGGVVYCIHILKKFGFDIGIGGLYDLSFLIYISVILATFFLGFIVFPKR